MDYCYSCRRNLNGALVCPGCGAYAPDIAPPAYRFESPAVAQPATMSPVTSVMAPAQMSDPLASVPGPWGNYGGEQFPDAGPAYAGPAHAGPRRTRACTRVPCTTGTARSSVARS